MFRSFASSVLSVADGELGGCSAIQGIKKLAVFQEHGFLVVSGCYRFSCRLPRHFHRKYLSVSFSFYSFLLLRQNKMTAVLTVVFDMNIKFGELLGN